MSAEFVEGVQGQRAGAWKRMEGSRQVVARAGHAICYSMM